MRRSKYKPKLLFFIPNLKGGGAEKMIVLLINEFTHKGYDVELALVKKEGVYLSALNKKVRIHDFASSKAIFVPLLLARLLIKNNYTVLISFLGYVNVIAIISKIISFKSLRVVVSERDRISNSLCIKNGFKKSFIIKGLMKLFYPFADSIIAISESAKSDLLNEIKLRDDKVKVIYNPFEPVDMNSSSLTNQMVDQRFLEWKKERKRIIVAVGRIVPVKNFPLLIEAFYELTKVHNDVRLLIIGEGGERDRVESLIKMYKLDDFVLLPGYVDNPSIYLKECAIFVSSSLSEGFGNVILEAMQASLPIIVTDSGGPVEILENGTWGHIASHDKNSLFHLMKIALKGPENVDYSLRLKCFTKEVIVDMYIKEIVK